MQRAVLYVKSEGKSHSASTAGFVEEPWFAENYRTTSASTPPTTTPSLEPLTGPKRPWQTIQRTKETISIHERSWRRERHMMTCGMQHSCSLCKRARCMDFSGCTGQRRFWSGHQVRSKHLKRHSG